MSFLCKMLQIRKHYGTFNRKISYVTLFVLLVWSCVIEWFVVTHNNPFPRLIRFEITSNVTYFCQTQTQMSGQRR